MSRSIYLSLAVLWAGCGGPVTGSTTLNEITKLCAPLDQASCGMNAECAWQAASSEHPAHCAAKPGSGDGTPTPSGCASYDAAKCATETSSCVWEAANAEHPARCAEKPAAPPAGDPPAPPKPPEPPSPAPGPGDPHPSVDGGAPRA